jgi:SAM-dependent methyltransferase
MSIKQHLFSQFANPRGPLGWLAGRIMSKRAGNVERTIAAIGLLELGAADRVLELGHGPGVGLERAPAAVPEGHVVGLEQSTTMPSMAARRNRGAVAGGRLSFVTADAQDPPTDLGEFDAIFSSNVWQFWADPVETLRRLAGHLAPGGRMAVTYRPPLAGATADEALDEAERIVGRLEAAGYARVRFETIEVGDVPAVVGLARSVR